MKNFKFGLESCSSKATYDVDGKVINLIGTIFAYREHILDIYHQHQQLFLGGENFDWRQGRTFSSGKNNISQPSIILPGGELIGTKIYRISNSIYRVFLSTSCLVVIIIITLIQAQEVSIPIYIQVLRT